MENGWASHNGARMWLKNRSEAADNLGAGAPASARRRLERLRSPVVRLHRQNLADACEAKGLRHDRVAVARAVVSDAAMLRAIVGNLVSPAMLRAVARRYRRRQFVSSKGASGSGIPAEHWAPYSAHFTSPIRQRPGALLVSRSRRTSEALSATRSRSNPIWHAARISPSACRWRRCRRCTTRINRELL